MPIRVIITCLLLMLIPLREAYAADITVEIRQRKGLLLLEGFEHSLGMVYQYSGHSANKENSSYSTNKLEELYRVVTYGAILDKHVLSYQLSGDIWFQQIGHSSDVSGSSNTNGWRGQYSLNASAFDRSWHPASVHSSRVLSTVTNPFTPAFETDSTNNGIELALLKGPVPTRFRYERITMDLTSGGNGSNTTSDSFQVSGTHNYKDISNSSIVASWNSTDSRSQGSSQTTDSVTFGLGNSLRLDRKNRYTLTSTLNWQKQDTAGVPNENLVLNELFLGHLGKALDADVSFSYQSNTTKDLAGHEQSFSSQSLAASVSHRLFDSLTTRLRGLTSTADFRGGTEDTLSGSVGLTYKKKLPLSSLLTVSLFGEYAIKDRRGTIPPITFRDEPHTVANTGDIFTLDNHPVVPASVTIRGWKTTPTNSPIPYPDDFTINVDYEIVDANTGEIRWIGLAPLKPDIHVTYVAVLDDSYKYDSDTVELTSTLSLFKGRYLVLGSIYEQNQNLISGQPRTSLRDTTIKRLRFQGNAAGTIYSLEYEDYAAGPTRYQFLEGLWMYNRTAPNWTLSLQARDRYTNYDSIGVSNGYGQNTMSGSVSFNRNLTSWAGLFLSGNFIDVRRDRQDPSDAIFFKASLRTRFNKLTVNLLGQSSWRIFGTSTTRDDYVRIEVTRYF